jgi:hypothetical protein
MSAAYFKHHYNTILILTPMPPAPLPQRGEGRVNSSFCEGLRLVHDESRKGHGPQAVWRRSGEFTSPGGGVKPPLHQPLPKPQDSPAVKPRGLFGHGPQAVWRRSGEFTSPRGGVKPPLHQPLPKHQDSPAVKPRGGVKPPLHQTDPLRGIPSTRTNAIR